MASSTGTVISVVALYFAVSMALVFANKTLLSPSVNDDGISTSIPAPLFVTWLQCLSTVGICALLGEYAGNEKDYPKFQFDHNRAKSILPLSCVFVGMITFNNLCLQYVEVSFYQVARSLTIVFNVVLTYIVLGESTSSKVLGSLVVVIAGFFLGTDGEINFSMIGTMFGVCSSLFVSVNAILTKRMLSVLDNSKSMLLMYNNANASLLFLPLIALLELDTLRQHSATLFLSTFWLLSIVSGVLGFAIGYVTALQIQVTSPLGHNISGTAKAAVQTVLAVIIYQNPITAKGMFGVVMVLSGSFGYAYIRRMESMSQPNEAPKGAEDIASGAPACSSGCCSNEHAQKSEV